MLIFDMLLALFLQLSLVTGEEGAFGIMVATAFVVIGGGFWLVNMFVEAVVNPSSVGSSPRRSQAALTAMSDDRLASRLAKNPRDPSALREQIRRSRASADPAELAARIEQLLAMKPKLGIEDLAMLHHQLADLYCGPLAQRLRATQVLAAFADAHPDTREAQFMRDRINHIGAMDVN